MSETIKWEDLPSEIQNRMLECQVEQGNKKDPEVFKKKMTTSKPSGGFTWSSTKEGRSFWDEIIFKNNVEHFYTIYPKKEKDEFKKGDYIVTTKETYSKAYPINHCFKQRHDCSYLSTELDNEGDTSKSHTFYHFMNKDRWRYATTDEIDAYNRFNKPFDVTILSSRTNIEEFSTGTYIVALADKLRGREKGVIKYGKIYEIVSGFLFSTCPYIVSEEGNMINFIPEDEIHNIRWFATKKEAETFAKTLKIETNPKFIVGKWYKYNNWYIKYLKHEIGGVWISSESINTHKVHSNLQSNFGYIDSEKILLEDLTEIQKYLPNNHPDKQPKSLVGRYFKVLKKFHPTVKDGDYLKITSDLNGENCYYVEEYGSLSVNRIKNKEVELMPEGFKPESVTIPEYVECVKGSNNTFHNKIGMIYKVKFYDPITGNLKIEGSEVPVKDIFFGNNTRMDNNTNYKPSTKEAYDAQFGVNDGFVLPEKWWVKVTNENHQILDDWRKKQPDVNLNISLAIKLLSHINYDRSYCSYGDRKVLKDYTEITFEQFKKYVLKEDTNTSFIPHNVCKEIKLNNPYDILNSDIEKSKIPSITLIEPTLYIKPKKNLLYTDELNKTQLDLPTIVRPKNSQIINY